MIERAAEIEWLTSRPKPDGFYGMSAFMKSVDTKLLGRVVQLHYRVPARS
jgi:hypothetical protein